MEKVELNLDENIPFGQSTMLMRMRVQDRRDVTNAATKLGMTQSQFARNMLVQAARKVLAEVVSAETTNA